MKVARESHKYSESGLSSVTLLNVEVVRCKECGEYEVTIPAIDELHKVIARAIVMKPERLVPEEARFLRKYLGLSQQDLGGLLGVTVEAISRWENGKSRMGLPAEKLLRMLAAQKEPIGRYERELGKVAVNEAKRSRLGLRRGAGGWRPVRAA